MWLKTFTCYGHHYVCCYEECFRISESFASEILKSIQAFLKTGFYNNNDILFVNYWGILSLPVYEHMTASAMS